MRKVLANNVEKEVGFRKAIHNGQEVNIDRRMTMVNGQMVCVFEQGFTREQEGVPPLTTNYECIGKDLKDYKIYGNSVQNGTPTPSNPIEIQSVGDKTNNLVPKFTGGTSNGITLTVDDYGVCTLNGTSTAIAIFTVVLSSPLPAGTYTISAYNTKTVQDSVFQLHTGDGWNNDTVASLHIANITSTGLVNKAIDMFRIRIGAGRTLSDFKIKPQLISGSSSQEYEPYGYYKIPISVSDGTTITLHDIYLNEPLRKIGIASDYIDFKNQKVVRKINVKKMLKSMGWYDQISGNHRTFTQLSDSLRSSDSTADCMSTISIGNADGVSANTSFRYTGRFYFVFPVGYFSTIQEWETYLDNNDVYGYYPLATPTEESITLPSIPSAKAVTIYNVDTSIKPSNMYIKYKSNLVKNNIIYTDGNLYLRQAYSATLSNNILTIR